MIIRADVIFMLQEGFDFTGTRNFALTEHAFVSFDNLSFKKSRHDISFKFKFKPVTFRFVSSEDL